MKLWVVLSSGWESTYVSSIWDSEEEALEEAARNTDNYEALMESEGTDIREYIYYVSSQPYLLNKKAN